MKKTFNCFNRVLWALLLYVGVVIISCEKIQPIVVNSVTLNSISMELLEGTTQTLVATISPSNADNQKVIWTSSNSSIATVTDGIVTAVKEGNATITVKTDEGGKTATCKVTVVAKEIPVSSISLDQTEIELMEGDELTLNATVTPDDATNKNVTWTSSDESVATVDNGKIIAVKEGNATITVKTDEGGKTATCEVTIVSKTINVSDISLNMSYVELTRGEEITLMSTITPENATNKNTIWASSNTEVAIVENGKVTAISEGTAKITARTEDGNKRATCQILVFYDSPDEHIQFADNIMKKMCVTAFDTNNDGELSFREAAAVTDLSLMNITDKTITSFNELKYFTGIESIPAGHFANTKIQSITLPNSLRVIEASAFHACSYLTDITFPDSIINIGSGAFNYCRDLTEIIIPNSVKNIEENAFRQCFNLETIVVTEGNSVYDSRNNCNCLIKTSNNQLILGCKRSFIPNSVISIADFAFYDCKSFKGKLIIPDSVTSIGMCAFLNCSGLTSVIIPDSVTYIGEQAFGGCSSLTGNLVLPNYITEINDYTFDQCSSLTGELIIPDSVTSIGRCAFQGCSGLTSLILESTLSMIEYKAFMGCLNLHNVYITRETPPTLGAMAFNATSNYIEDSLRFFVPYMAVMDYKTANGWSEYVSKIVGYDYINNKVVE